MLDLHIARQPVYTSHLELFAYELLCRSDKGDGHEPADGSQATSQVILNAFAELGLEKLAGKYPVFIKMPRQFLLGDYPLSGPSHRIYLEIVEGERIDAELLAAAERLAQEGYRLILHGQKDWEGPEARALLGRVDIVKLDLQRVRLPALPEQIEKARRYSAKLCIEKVETQAEFERCKALGVDYVQGSFFCQPKAQEGRQVAPNRVALLQLLAKFNDPKIRIDDLVKNISQDVALTYKLLRTLNSAIYNLPTKIHSIRQGLVMLGMERIKVWATMILLSKLVDKPQELMVTALVRAQMCEQLAQPLGQARQAESFFMVGLFSVLDAMMDSPMDVVVGKLPLADEVAEALLQHTGPLGTALRCVLAYEKGEFRQISQLNLDSGMVRTIYLESVAWADATSKQLVQP